MTERDAVIDIMGPAGDLRVSRWDRHDGEGAIRALDEALKRAGLVDALAVPMRMLAEGQAFFDAAGAAKTRAAERRDAAREALRRAGPIDVDAAEAYGRVRAETSGWLDGVCDNMQDVMTEGHQRQQNATQTTFAMVHGLFKELQSVCAGVVAEVTAVPVLPREVWSAATTGQASTLAVRGRHELAWSALVRLGDQWDAVHAAAALLVETGTFGAELHFDQGCRTNVGMQFLAWEKATEQLPRINRLPAPLRVRGCVDAGLRPGLFLASDHRADRERAAARSRGLLARLVG
jgi:hypothetical protein